MNVPKKWWWLVGVAVPIVAAAIADCTGFDPQW